ncbi:hypothetical protein, partial [Staphylococcus aureus]
EFGDVVSKKGDIVIQLIDRQNGNRFNGDIGVVVGIFCAKENTLKKGVHVADYEGNEATCTKQDMMELT